MGNILNNVNCILSDEDLKQIIEYYKDKDISLQNSIYDYFRSDVPEDEIKNCVGYEEFFIQYFKDCMDAIKNNQDMYYDRSLIQDKYKNLNNNFKCIDDLLSSDQYSRLYSKPIFFIGNDSETRTICVNGSYGSNLEKEKYDCRIYMCPKMENIIPLVKEIINYHKKMNLNCFLKFNTNSNDNDRLILYSSLKNMDKHLDILKQIQKNNNELFENMGKNKLWGEINGMNSVYFGMNPRLYNYGSSYLSIRSVIIESALLELKNMYSPDQFDKMNNRVLQHFKDLIRIYSIALNINPDNFCLNLNNDNSKRNKSPITLKTNVNDVPIIVNYLLPDKNNVIVSTPLYINDIESFIKISIDDLEKLYSDDLESEKIKKQLLKKVELLHTKNKIKYGYKLRKNNSNHHGIVSVNASMNSISFNGNISYGLYKSIPSIVSDYICVLMSRYEDQKRGTVDILTLEDLSRITDEVFNMLPYHIDEIKDVLEETKKEQSDKKLVKKTI